MGDLVEKTTALFKLRPRFTWDEQDQKIPVGKHPETVDFGGKVQYEFAKKEVNDRVQVCVYWNLKGNASPDKYPPSIHIRLFCPRVVTGVESTFADELEAKNLYDSERTIAKKMAENLTPEEMKYFTMTKPCGAIGNDMFSSYCIITSVCGSTLDSSNVEEHMDTIIGSTFRDIILGLIVLRKTGHVHAHLGMENVEFVDDNRPCINIGDYWSSKEWSAEKEALSTWNVVGMIISIFQTLKEQPKEPTSVDRLRHFIIDCMNYPVFPTEHEMVVWKKKLSYDKFLNEWNGVFEESASKGGGSAAAKGGKPERAAAAAAKGGNTDEGEAPAAGEIAAKKIRKPKKQKGNIGTKNMDALQFLIRNSKNEDGTLRLKEGQTVYARFPNHDSDSTATITKENDFYFLTETKLSPNPRYVSDNPDKYPKFIHRKFRNMSRWPQTVLGRNDSGWRFIKIRAKKENKDGKLEEDPNGKPKMLRTMWDEMDWENENFRETYNQFKKEKHKQPDDDFVEFEKKPKKGSAHSGKKGKRVLEEDEEEEDEEDDEDEDEEAADKFEYQGVLRDEYA